VSGFDSKVLLERGRSLLAGFTTGQKAITAIALVAAVVGGMLFVSWASKPTYAPLFTSLSSSDAAAITAKLADAKEPYQLADGGTSILVPQKDVYQQRINLSGAGLPAGGTQGYSLLDKQSLTTSEFQQHVTYQRALEGELSKTIDVIDGVEASVVHLAIPEQDVFATDAGKPSASVLIKTQPGVTLRPSQVQAVLHLVSASVPKLAPADVAITDATGKVLNAPGSDALGSAMADARTEQTSGFEQATIKNVQSMLDKVLGPHHAIVRVQAELNYDKQTTDTEQYITDKNVPPLSVTTSKETYTGAGTPVGGVLGPDNISVPAGGGGQSKYQKDDQTQTNAVGTRKETVTVAPGRVRRMSVAVVLDQSLPAASGNTANISQLVAAAAGVDPTRGDNVQVTTMPFDTSADKQTQQELAQAAKDKQHAQTMSLVKTLGVLLLVALVLIWLVRRSRKVERTPVYLPALAGDTELEALAARPDELALEPAPPARELEAPDPQHLARLAVRSEIGELIEQQPDEVARLLRGWLADRRP
jgi:flagellar M-ring protein FliF